MKWWGRKPKKKSGITNRILRRAVKMCGARIRSLERDLAAAEAALEAVKDQCDKRMEFAEDTVTRILAVFSQAAQTPGVAVNREAVNFDKWAAEFDAVAEEVEGATAGTREEMAGMSQRIDEVWGGVLTAEEMWARRKAYDKEHPTQVGDEESGE